jgi:plastocyanin
MHFRYIPVALGITSLALLCLIPDRAQAHGRRSSYGPVSYAPAPVVYHEPCRPAYDAPPMYHAPCVSHAPPMYRQPSYGPGSSARPTTTITVGAYDNSFEPKRIHVQPGTTVRWVNYGKHTHTVTSRDGRWDSGDVPPGALYSATFQNPGTYGFYCRHHKGMEGTIVVGSGGGTGYGGSERSGN